MHSNGFSSDRNHGQRSCSLFRLAVLLENELWYANRSDSTKSVVSSAPISTIRSLGVGYHLILSKDAHSDPEAIFQLVCKHVDQAQLESAISAECKILLPHGAAAKFPDLFTELEQNKDALQIFSIGLSETSIEEVFMKM